MEWMPFTFLHTAAALPFRGTRLVPSALIVGTMAPDFEYFLRFSPGGGYGHTFAGAFFLSLPLALVVLWIFHAIVKVPLIRLFPERFRLRLATHIGRFSFRGMKQFVLIVVSVLIGIATHIIWDSFTHRHKWPLDHWTLLRQGVHVPVFGVLPLYKVLLHTSNVVGALVLCAWVMGWYRRTEPHHDDKWAAIPSARKWLVVTSITSLALFAGIGRSTVFFGGRAGYLVRAGDGVVTAIAIGWWLLVAYAIVASARSTVPGGA
jgi:hypothetical protein